jgi:LPS-assembly protein
MNASRREENKSANIFFTWRGDLTIVLLIAIIILISGLPSFAVEQVNNENPVNIEADSMDYDKSSDVYHAKGKATIIYSGVSLYADDMELDNNNNVATAQGSAFLKMREDTLRGDKIVFNIVDKTGAAYNAQAFYARNHFYVKGDKIEKTGENTYFIEQPAATTCDGDYPDWQITGREMKVTIEGYGSMKNACFRVKGIPFLYSPYIIFPAKTSDRFFVSLSGLFQR